jgi:hypothetical protein
LSLSNCTSVLPNGSSNYDEAPDRHVVWANDNPTTVCDEGAGGLIHRADFQSGSHLSVVASTIFVAEFVMRRPTWPRASFRQITS